MNCYSALTKEEALTTPPVTLAKGFVKQVCASLAFQLAGIHCSLLHGNLCSGKGWVVVAAGASRWAFALLPTAASSRRHGTEPAPLRGKSDRNCPHSFLEIASLRSSHVSLFSHRILEKTWKIVKSNLGFSHSGTLLRMTCYLLGEWNIILKNGMLFSQCLLAALVYTIFLLTFSYRYLGTW